MLCALLYDDLADLLVDPDDPAVRRLFPWRTPIRRARSSIGS